MAEIEFDDGTRVEIPDDVVSSIRADEVSPEALLAVVLPKLSCLSDRVSQIGKSLQEEKKAAGKLAEQLKAAEANAKKKLRIIR